MKLKSIRLHAELNQAQMASIFKVSRSTYGMWEQEKDIIPLEHLIDVCNYFGLSLDYVMEFSKKTNYSNNKKDIDKNLLMKRMRLIRKLNNISQVSLARALSVASSTICKYESGKSIPTTSYLMNFCEYFKISCDYITGKIDEELTINILNKVNA